ncbi:MAG: hypothetical protein ACLTE2_10925 [Eubacteriales bacterium]
MWQTATAIGRELGILDENGMALTGAQLDQMEQHQLEKKFTNIVSMQGYHLPIKCVL